MKVGCKGGTTGTFAGFPIGKNLIEDPLGSNTLEFDLGANFWDDDDFDTIVTVTARYVHYKPSPVPLASSRNDYSILSYSIHRAEWVSGLIYTRMSGNMTHSSKNYPLSINRDGDENVIRNSGSHTVIITGIFINKTEKPISWNYRDYN
jgi:hypothetical protein